MKKMKKVISAMLAATMIFSTGLVAFADIAKDANEVKSEEVAMEEDLVFEFKKEYVDADGNTIAAGLVPAEVLDFEVVADTDNPSNINLSVEDPTIATNPQSVKITIPNTYTVVGQYEYTVKEIKGSTQGVTYLDNTFRVQVLVTYDETDSTHTQLKKQVSFISNSEKNEGYKVDRIYNQYDLGDLDIVKTVTGNLGSQTDEFVVKVVLTSDTQVLSPITYNEKYSDTTKRTIETSAWTESSTGGYVTAEIPVTVKHGEKVTFENLPYGVTYKVVETPYTSGDKNNALEGYDAAMYAVNKAENTAAEDVATVMSEATDTVDTLKETVDIVNNKETSVATGISLDNMPYIMVLALVALGLVGFVSKKRSMEF